VIERFEKKRENKTKPLKKKKVKIKYIVLVLTSLFFVIKMKYMHDFRVFIYTYKNIIV
jgi:hypothetical protein